MGLGSTNKLSPMVGDLLSEETSPTCPVEIRAKIYKLEAAMKRSYNKIHIEPRHHFSKGIYAREITIPAATVLTGHIHRTEHLNILSQGTITVLTENGLETLSAPCTIVSKPGTKRVGYTHSECVWTTIHGTDETDLDKLKEDLIIENHDQLTQEEMDLLLGGGK